MENFGSSDEEEDVESLSWAVRELHLQHPLAGPPQPAQPPRRPGTLGELPDEVLLQVFRWLRPEDLALRASRVCVRWERVSRDPCLWRRASWHYRSGPVAARLLALAPCFGTLAFGGISRRLGGAGDSSCLARPPASSDLALAPARIRRLRAAYAVLPQVLYLLERSRDHLRELEVLAEAPHRYDALHAPRDHQRFWKLVAGCRRLEALTVHPVRLLDSAITFLPVANPATLRRLEVPPIDMYDFAVPEALSAVVRAHQQALEAVTLPWISGPDVQGSAMVELFRALGACPQLREAVVPCRMGVAELQSCPELQALTIYGDDVGFEDNFQVTIHLEVAGRLTSLTLKWFTELHVPAPFPLPHLASLHMSKLGPGAKPLDVRVECDHPLLERLRGRSVAEVYGQALVHMRRVQSESSVAADFIMDHLSCQGDFLGGAVRHLFHILQGSIKFGHSVCSCSESNGV